MSVRVAQAWVCSRSWSRQLGDHCITLCQWLVPVHTSLCCPLYSHAWATLSTELHLPFPQSLFSSGGSKYIMFARSKSVMAVAHERRLLLTLDCVSRLTQSLTHHVDAPSESKIVHVKNAKWTFANMPWITGVWANCVHRFDRRRSAIFNPRAARHL